MTSGALPQMRRRWRELRTRLSPPYQYLLEDAVGDAETVLDVGCGDSSPLGAFRRRRRSVGVDAFAPAVERSRAAGIHDAYELADVRTIEELFEPRAFDAAVAIDVLEHLDESDGLQLLRAMETIARSRVVVFTPNGYVHQEERGGNPWQRHRSGWPAARLARLGYDVTGVHGLRWLRTEEAQIRWRPRRAWHLVSDLSQPVAARVPALAFHLLAVKDFR